MEESTVLIALAGLLSLVGIVLMVVAVARARYVSCTAGETYLSTPMRVVDANLVPNNLTGEAAAGPPSDRTSIVLVNYTYSVAGSQFQSRDVFPLSVEWMRPRVSPLKLFEDLKAGRVQRCYVDPREPGRALLFTGWSPYLRSHVLGVGAGGLVTFVVGLALLALMVKG